MPVGRRRLAGDAARSSCSRCGAAWAPGCSPACCSAPLDYLMFPTPHRPLGPAAARLPRGVRPRRARGSRAAAPASVAPRETASRSLEAGGAVVGQRSIGVVARLRRALRVRRRLLRRRTRPRDSRSWLYSRGLQRDVPAALARRVRRRGRDRRARPRARRARRGDLSWTHSIVGAAPEPGGERSLPRACSAAAPYRDRGRRRRRVVRVARPRRPTSPSATSTPPSPGRPERLAALGVEVRAVSRPRRTPPTSTSPLAEARARGCRRP